MNREFVDGITAKLNQGLNEQISDLRGEVHQIDAGMREISNYHNQLVAYMNETHEQTLKSVNELFDSIAQERVATKDRLIGRIKELEGERSSNVTRIEHLSKVNDER